MATKWGIMSAGKISNDFVNALNYLPKEEHKIIAVGASNKERAQSFASQHNIPNAYGSYEEVANDKSIDVIYVGAINKFHYSLCKMVLENGKHLLCEKPFSLNVKDAQTLISLAKEKKLFLMEAVWSRFFPLYDELKKLLASDAIGQIHQLTASFGIPISTVPRIKEKELGGGTVFDLGVYVLQLAILVFGRKPSSVQATGFLNENGVDECMNCILKYNDGQIANLITHSKVKMDNSAIIYGTKGYIKIKEPFWCPTVLVVNEKEKTFPLPQVDGKMSFVNSEGLIYEAMEVRECIEKGLLESPKMTHEDTLTLAKLEEEILKIVGYKF